jgi:Galactose-3-O-sulfotransferase
MIDLRWVFLARHDSKLNVLFGVDQFAERLGIFTQIPQQPAANRLEREANMRDNQAVSEQTVIFVHVFRTAGTTLYRIIDRNFSQGSVYTVPENGTVEEFKKLSDPHKRRIRVLRGHLGFGLHQSMPQPCAYVTLLREPVERMISYYYFICRTPDHYCYHLIRDNQMRLEDFIRCKQDIMIDNIQTRFLSGLETGYGVGFGQCTRDMLEAAKRNLERHFAVVGLTEGFDSTLLLLKRALGWRRLAYVRHNVTSNRPEKRKISQAALDAIAEVNALDTELYEYAQMLFEEQVRRQGPSFAQEVKDFQIVNQRLSPFIRLYWEARKVSVRTMIRKWIKP